MTVLDAGGMATLKLSFREFIYSTNTDGSGKAASYVRALDMLGPILTKHYPKPIVVGSISTRDLKYMLAFF